MHLRNHLLSFSLVTSRAVPWSFLKLHAPKKCVNYFSMDVSDIFYFLLFWGGGERKEASEEVAGGGPVLIENKGGFRGGGAGGGRAPGECLWGGELNIFFRGRNAHQDFWFSLHLHFHFNFLTLTPLQCPRIIFGSVSCVFACLVAFTCLLGVSRRCLYLLHLHPANVVEPIWFS